MIVEKIMYTAKCDSCGRDAFEDDEAVAWTDPESVEIVMDGNDWQITDDGKHLCPNCRTDNDDEN